jgi:porphobilinogen synthase
MGPLEMQQIHHPKVLIVPLINFQLLIEKKLLNSSIINAAQGANYLMVKPGMTSIDLIADIKKETLLPTGAYQVSGEFASLQLLEANKLGKYPDFLNESLNVFSRAKQTL